MKIKRISPRKTILGAFVVASLVSATGCGVTENIARNLQGNPQTSIAQSQPESSSTVNEQKNYTQNMSAKKLIATAEKNFKQLSSYRMKTYSETRKDFNVTFEKSGKENSVSHIIVDVPQIKAMEIYSENINGQADKVYLNAAGFWLTLSADELSSQLEDVSFVTDATIAAQQYFDFLKSLPEDELGLNVDESISGVGDVVGIHFTDKNEHAAVMYISKETLLPVRIKIDTSTYSLLKSTDIEGSFIIDLYDFNKVDPIQIPEDAKNASSIDKIADNVLKKLRSAAKDFQ